MKILVTGAKGQLGYDVCRRLSALGIEHLGVDIADFDLTDAGQVREAIASYAPGAVIHCAAYTAVDKAESEPERCRLVNVEGTRNLAQACAVISAKMMLISTDYVFDGAGEQPFETDAARQPQNVYGRTKLDSELVVQEVLAEHFIVRTAWVFGANGGNFVRTMLRLGAEREEIAVVADQVGSPTYTEDLAVLLCEIVRSDRYGIYHATNEGYCSWFEFATEIMRRAGLSCRVLPVASEQYLTPAKRPRNSRLSKRSLDEAGFARLPDWQDALQRFLAVEGIK